MPQEHILLVEDDKNISKLVKYNLEKAGFQCTAVVTGEDAFEVLSTESIDLVILDIMLPKMDGLEVCKEIRADQRMGVVPIVMLTAKGEEVDRIVGFELGADDYMVKPFSPRELILRIKAILKRKGSESKEKKEEKSIVSAFDIHIDVGKHKVTVKNKPIILTAMEFKLLLILLRRQGRVQSREQLLEDVWELDSDLTTRTVDTHIKRLRQKLGDQGQHIETVRGYGYRFSEDD